jgi:hypothetical protein
VISKSILLIATLYGSALAYLYFAQESFIFNLKDANFKPFTCKGCVRAVLHTKDGAELIGKRRPKNSSKLLIYFGGNADDATKIFTYLDPDLDIEVVAYNYRGYGESSHKPSQEALFKDALAIYDFHAKDKDVTVIGRSLGTGVGAYLASKRKVSHLILITPYDSIRAIAKAKYPFFPIANVQSKVSVIEVIGDKVVPNFHTANLLKAINNLSLHVKLQDTTHGDVLEKIDFNSLLNSPSPENID